jgi:hypothetical protein
MKECYGKIFPELPELNQINHTASGKVFQAQIRSIGPFHREPHLAMNLKAWEECQQCPHYNSCYDLSNARLAMQQALYRV